MSVVVLVDSMFHLHTLKVLAVPFRDPRDSYSYTAFRAGGLLLMVTRTVCIVAQTDISAPCLAPGGVLEADNLLGLLAMA